MSLINPAQFSPEAWDEFRTSLLQRLGDAAPHSEALVDHIIESDHDAEQIEHIQGHLVAVIEALLQVGNSLDLAKTYLIGGRAYFATVTMVASEEEFPVPTLVDPEAEADKGLSALDAYLASLAEDDRPTTE